MHSDVGPLHADLGRNGHVELCWPKSSQASHISNSKFILLIDYPVYRGNPSLFGGYHRWMSRSPRHFHTDKLAELPSRCL